MDTETVTLGRPQINRECGPLHQCRVSPALFHLELRRKLIFGSYFPVRSRLSVQFTSQEQSRSWALRLLLESSLFTCNVVSTRWSTSSQGSRTSILSANDAKHGWHAAHMEPWPDTCYTEYTALGKNAGYATTVLSSWSTVPSRTIS